MRTTLTLDEDVALLLKKENRRAGEPLKETVNRCLRKGLTTQTVPPKRKPFKVKPFDMPLSKHFNFDKPWTIIEELDGPMHR